MLVIRAWACGQRSIRACSMPGRLMSKLYLARPVAFSGPSRRCTLVPMIRRVCGHGIGRSSQGDLLFRSIRNPNIETRNKFEIRKRKSETLPDSVDFEFRYSDLF